MNTCITEKYAVGRDRLGGWNIPLKQLKSPSYLSSEALAQEGDNIRIFDYFLLKTKKEGVQLTANPR